MQPMAVPAIRERTKDRLGRYRLLAILGRGGMADVYLAASDGMEGFSKLLVVKELRRERDDDDARLAMFMDEARLAARFNHPHIVQTLEVSSDGPRVFTVMEYLEGQSLRRTLGREPKMARRLPADAHIGILSHVLDALAYLHGLADRDGTPLAIVHRDVSPHNVLVTYEGQVKLIDFGIAKTQVASNHTSAGVVKGKIRYMAPEQATGQSVDCRTDVFSVGVMLWEALMGRGPWDGQSDLQVLRSLMAGEVPRLAHQPNALPAGLIAVVDRAMSPTREDRYASATAMREALLQHVQPSQLGDHARTLGAFVSGAFAQERRELRAVVDAQLRGVAADNTQSLVSLTRLRATDTYGSFRPGTGGRPIPSGSAHSLAGQAPHPSSYAPAAGSRPRLAIAATAILVMALAAGLGLRAQRAWRTEDMAAGVPSETGAPAASAQGEPRSAVPAAPSRSVHITARALPVGARLSVDGVAVANPYAADMPHEETPHVLSADGPGLVRQTRTFVATRDTDIEVALARTAAPWGAPKGLASADERSRAASAPAASPAAVPPPERPAAPPPPPSTPTARGRRTREMDKDNPYQP